MRDLLDDSPGRRRRDAPTDSFTPEEVAAVEALARRRRPRALVAMRETEGAAIAADLAPADRVPAPEGRRPRGAPGGDRAQPRRDADGARPGALPGRRRSIRAGSSRRRRWPPTAPTSPRSCSGCRATSTSSTASSRNGDGSVGKTLDFLTQEILRELNTLGSKSRDLTSTREVLDMKAETEKIREQVQNVE